ncbi:MAG: hypothetical protein ABTR92_16460 [Candidatus Accumulibacter phosphatis]
MGGSTQASPSPWWSKGLCRATVYAQRRPPVVDGSDLVHSRLIDEEYTRHPFYGTRRMVIFLAPPCANMT